MTKRTRFQIRFWLDAMRDDDLVLLEEIDTLKRNRSFTQTIRDGLRLVLDLRKGRVDVLLELFPHVKEAFGPTIERKPAKRARDGEDNRYVTWPEIVGLLVQQTPEVSRALPGNTGNAKLLGTGSRILDLPTYDDLDDDLALAQATKSKTNGQSTQTFLASLDKLNS